MTMQTANATWQGKIKQGEGRFELGSGSCAGGFSFNTRFGDEKGTNPEELIGAAHAGCYSMAFSKILEEAGHEPQEIQTRADVELSQADGGFTISQIALTTEASVPGIDDDTFKRLAEKAKNECVVSKALSTDIRLDARLRS